MREGTVPDRLGYVVGMRGWFYDTRRERLVSKVNRTIWEPRRRLQAECFLMSGAPPHVLDDRYHRCGIYAYKHDCLVSTVQKTPIQGAVALWGKIVEHSEGYRAQYAYPLGFLCPVGSMKEGFFSSSLKGVASLYGVPIVPAVIKKAVLITYYDYLRSRGTEKEEWVLDKLQRHTKKCGVCAFPDVSSIGLEI